jgi:Zn ribbon nucleic-acid-binding protein
MGQRKVYKSVEIFKRLKIVLGCVRCGWQSTVTRVDVKEQLHQHIRDNRKIRIYKIAPEISLHSDG